MTRTKYVAPIALLLILFCISLGGEAPAAAEKIGPVRDKVSIFVTSWCPYCKHLEEFLRENHVPYTRYDIETDPKGAMLHTQLGGGGVPVIVVGTTVLHGFDESELTPLLMERRGKWPNQIAN